MDILSILAALVLLAAVSYAGYLFWSKVFELRQSGKLNQDNLVRVMTAFVIAVASFAVTMPYNVAAFAQSETTIEFDLTPFFTSLNQYLPIFIGLFAIVGGIAGAMALARYVIGAVVRAFSGGTI